MLSNRLRAAVVQLRSLPDVAENIAVAESQIRAAAAAGATLVATPENTAYLGPEGKSETVASDLDGRIVGHFRALASELEIALLLGSFVENGPGDGRVHNTSVMIGPDGSIVASYRKMHLFDVETPTGHVLRESENIAPGREPKVAELGPWRLGMTVCYDLRFPELYRALTALGANILSVPAAFTAETGPDHWEVLLRARAIENQCYVLAPDQHGHHFGRRRSYGRSMIIDPWGNVVGKCSDRIGFVTAELDLSELQDLRTRFPCLEHQRLDPR